jgi:nicotinate dehydrogenase subunit B
LRASLASHKGLDGAPATAQNKSRNGAAAPAFWAGGVRETLAINLTQRKAAAWRRHMGEGSQGPAAAAVANAFANATGKRIRDLPLKAERVKAALM